MYEQGLCVLRLSHSPFCLGSRRALLCDDTGGTLPGYHSAGSFPLPIHCLLHNPKRHKWPQLETPFGSLICLLLSPSERSLCAQGNSGFSGFREVREWESSLHPWPAPLKDRASEAYLEMGSDLGIFAEINFLGHLKKCLKKDLQHF